jgi:hypothetical protein
MKSDLDQIIEYLESEKQSLELSIKSYLLEKDFQYAHYQQEELWRVNNKLATFQYFKDPLYHKKQELERLKELFNGFDENDNLTDIYHRRITKKENEIKTDQLTASYFNDTQVIDDALFELYERRFKKFRLCLNKPSALYLYFELNVNNLLSISISSDAVLDMYGYDKENYDDEDEERELFILKKMGFEQSDGLDWIVYHIDMNDFKDATAIKLILARISYDVFGLTQGSQYLQSTLEYLL